MNRCLFLAFLLLPFAALAQSETCPRVWRSGDSLLTDPAPAIQWLRDGVAIPGANERWLVPTEAGSYAVEASSAASPAYAYRRGYALAGYVFDELHRPIEGASVRKGAFAVTSDEKGRFSLWIDERKPEATAPVVLVVEKDGHWRNASRQYVSAFETTETRIMLHTRRVTNRVDASKGGEMAYQGFTLQLPPNGVQTEDGALYNGTILLSVEGSRPTDPDFGLRMPGGSFDAIDANGNDVMLYSYGYLSAEMTTEGGEKLELRPEARATLRFYLPWNETLRPDTVPLWHFNTETALWVQEGWSVRNGSIYEGEVSHFSSWNCDWPTDRGTCKGRVIDCNDETVLGGWVRVGQREVVSDSLGNYWSFVPGGITFDTWAASDTLREITIPATEERTLQDLTGRDFSGAAWYNPLTRTLNINLSGNIPTNLRMSIDGGASWTEEREFTGVSTVPSEALLDGACIEQLRVIVLGRQEDCRYLNADDLSMTKKFFSWEDALGANEPVFNIDLGMGRFNDNWDLLEHFPCLASLILSNNQLNDLDESIGNLTNLNILELHTNRLTNLPEYLFNLTNLQTLALSGNLLTNLPENLSNLTQLRKLDISFNQITSLPEFLTYLTNLESLTLGGNLFTELPENFSNLTMLRSLTLNHMQLAAVPERISNLNSLNLLWLQNNNLTVAPEFLGNLTSLRTLDLGENQLNSIHESICNLPRLRTLVLNRNRLLTLPESIGNLTTLQILLLSNNQLTDLPASIANLADTLQTLNLQDNPIPVERRAAIQAMLPNTTIIW